MLKIVHIINPVKVDESSDLFLAQPITFESMKRAKDFAKDEVEVQLISTQYEEDYDIIPDYFVKTSNLTRSVLDLGVFNTQRKLPLLKDIFQNAYIFDSDADYIIYTNTDIALYPHFYLSIKEYVSKGYDGICINRNTLMVEGINNLKLAELYTLRGLEHEGIDCFVIKKELIPKMIFKNSIIGTGPVGLIIAQNLLYLCNNFTWIRKANLTFHLGDDKFWLDDKINENSLLLYNYKEFGQIMRSIKERLQDDVKIKVAESSIDMVNYLINNKEFKQNDNSKKLLALYSDRNFQKIKDFEEIESPKKITKNPTTFIKNKIKFIIKNFN